MVCVLTARRLARDQKAIEQHMNGILYKTAYMKCKSLGTSTLVGLLALCFVPCVRDEVVLICAACLCFVSNLISVNRCFMAAYRWSQIKSGYLHI